jgi:hypothetical protein
MKKQSKKRNKSAKQVQKKAKLEDCNRLGTQLVREAAKYKLG